MADDALNRLAETSWAYVSSRPWADLSLTEQGEHARTVKAIMAVASQPPMAPQLPFDGRPVHDSVASVVALARTILADIRGKADATLPVARLELLLTTLIGLAERPTQTTLRDAQARTVAGRLAEMRGAASRVAEVR